MNFKLDENMPEKDENPGRDNVYTVTKGGDSPRFNLPGHPVPGDLVTEARTALAVCMGFYEDIPSPAIFICRWRPTRARKLSIIQKNYQEKVLTLPKGGQRRD